MADGYVGDADQDVGIPAALELVAAGDGMVVGAIDFAAVVQPGRALANVEITAVENVQLGSGELMVRLFYYAIDLADG